MTSSGLDDARGRDATDPLRAYREKFHIPDGVTYVDGNSLGLMPIEAGAMVEQRLDEWRKLAIDGWLEGHPPWYTYSESMRTTMADLVGALPNEVIVTGTTTVNLHGLVSTLYEPSDARRKVVATSLDFPSDIYALKSQIALRGGNPRLDLIKVRSRDGRTVDESDVVEALGEDVVLLLMPSVLYRSGQLLDIARLAAAAHERGVIFGVDAAHSVGAVPHSLHDWGVDFAFWCTYKYLNAGPAAPGALYVHERHHRRLPALAGWWGSDKKKQFDMEHTFTPAADAGRWQISAPPILSLAPLQSSLEVFREVGIDAVRQGSLARTDFLIQQLEERELFTARYGYAIGTPREHSRRGGHVAIEHAEAESIAIALRRRGIVPDFRRPNVIRVAPVALYNTFEDCWRVARHLKDIVDSREHLRPVPAGDAERNL